VWQFPSPIFSVFSLTWPPGAKETPANRIFRRRGPTAVGARLCTSVARAWSELHAHSWIFASGIRTARRRRGLHSAPLHVDVAFNSDGREVERNVQKNSPCQPPPPPVRPSCTCDRMAMSTPRIAAPPTRKKNCKLLHGSRSRTAVIANHCSYV
jgi:hypothetical protein